MSKTDANNFDHCNYSLSNCDKSEVLHYSLLDLYVIQVYV